MFTVIKQYLESHSIRSDLGVARKERRDARHARTHYRQSLARAKKIDEAFEQGEKTKIQRSFEDYKKIMEHELHDLKEIINDYKTLMQRALAETRDLRAAVLIAKKSNHFTAQQITAITSEVELLERELAKKFDKYFRSLTSFESINISTLALLDAASVLNDLFYQTKEMRKEVAAFNRAIHSEIKALRRGKSDDHVTRIKESTAKFKKELDRCGKELADVIQLLQKFQANFDKMSKNIEKEKDDDTYPPGWAAENMAVVAALHREVKQLVDEEIEKARIFMSKEER